MTPLRESAELSRKPHRAADGLSGRQWLLLKLLDALGGSAKNLDFQKFLFLYCQEPESGRQYDFVPYKFGAFSYTSYADRRKLVSLSLLAEDDHGWRLTPEGRKLVEGKSDIFLTAFVQELGPLHGDALVAETYRRFPFYATKSEIAERVLKGDTGALAKIRAEQSAAEGQDLLTIGYEGRSLEGYLNTLLRANVSILCDVRRNPLSRKYGFSKSTLSAASQGVGIRYEHLPDLGIDSQHRQDLESQEDYDALFELYERDWLPQQTDSLESIQGWIEAGERVALTCFELMPHQCHRHCVAEALEKLLAEGIRAKHL